MRGSTHRVSLLFRSVAPVPKRSFLLSNPVDPTTLELENATSVSPHRQSGTLSARPSWKNETSRIAL